MNIAPSCSEKNICQGYVRCRKCANFSSGFATTTKRSFSPAPEKKTDTEYYINLLKIENLIEGYTSADDADRSKPAPDIFTAALEKLNVKPAEAIAVGDTRFDVEAAAKVGLKTIALTCGGIARTSFAPGRRHRGLP